MKKHIKLFEQFLNESNKFNSAKLDKFLDKFPNDSKSWSQATEELADMYVWITDNFNEWNEDNSEIWLKPVGRKNCKTPSEWNTKYKAAIIEGLSKMKNHQKDKFAKEFSHYFK